MKILFLMTIALFFISCSSSKNTVSPDGYVIFSVASQNANLIFFELFFENIYIVDKNDKYTRISSDKQFSVNFSNNKNHADLLFKMQVPTGLYQAVVVDLNLSKSSIKTIESGNIHTPDIYDVFGFNTRKTDSVYRIYSNINGGIPLAIFPDETAYLTMTVDVDASVNTFFIDENNNSTLVISPVFSMKSDKRLLNQAMLSAKVEHINKQEVSLKAITSSDDVHESIIITLTNDIVYKINESSVELGNFIDLVNKNLNGVAIFSERVENSILVSELRYITENYFHVFEGYVRRDSLFIGSKETFMPNNRTYSFLQKTIDRVDSRDAPFFVSSVSNDEDLIFSQFKIKDILSVGSVDSQIASSLELQPQSINGLDASLFFNEEDRVTISNSSNKDAISGFGWFQGKFSNQSFDAIKSGSLDNSIQRLTISAPLTSEAGVVEKVMGQGFKLNNNLGDDMIMYMKSIFSPEIDSMKDKIEYISLNLQPKNITLTVERVLPVHENISFTLVTDFLDEVTRLKESGYVINSLIANGYLDNKTFYTDSLIVKVLPIEEPIKSELLDSKENAILEGPIFRRFMKFLKDGFFRMNRYLSFSPKDKGNAKNKKIKSQGIINNSKNKGVGGYANLDMAAFTKAQSNIRNIEQRNPYLGGYLSNRINASLSQELIDNVPKIIQLAKDLESIEPIKELMSNTNPMKETRYRVLLDEYMLAYESGDRSVMERSPLHQYLKDKEEFLKIFSGYSSEKYYLDAIEAKKSDFSRSFKEQTTLMGLILDGDSEDKKIKKLLLNNPDFFQIFNSGYEKLVVNIFDEELKFKNAMVESDKKELLFEEKLEIAKEKNDMGYFYNDLHKAIGKNKAAVASGKIQLENGLAYQVSEINKVIVDSIKNLPVDSAWDTDLTRQLIDDINKSIQYKVNIESSKYSSSKSYGSILNYARVLDHTVKTLPDKLPTYDQALLDRPPTYDQVLLDRPPTYEESQITRRTLLELVKPSSNNKRNGNTNWTLEVYPSRISIGDRVKFFNDKTTNKKTSIKLR